MKGRIKLTALMPSLAMIAALLTGLSALHWMAASPGKDGEVDVVIEPGQKLKGIADSLEKAGAIRSSLYFVWFARLKGDAKGIRAGEYMIPGNSSPGEVLDRLVHGRVFFRQVTIPEGKTLSEIAWVVEKAGIVSRDAFLHAAANTSGMEPWLSPGAPDLEGLLFPETYAYTRNTTAADFVKMMTTQFRRVFEPIWKDRDPTLTLKPYEAVILASIIEKETGRADERPVVAAVFLNRLKQNMRLESDPTVIYGIPNFAGNLRRANLEKPTPYNTYTHAGLPVGPICNPGVASIRAVMHPAQNNLLYFVSKGDGTHQFSSSLAEHNAAVQLYQKGNR